MLQDENVVSFQMVFFINRIFTSEAEDATKLEQILPKLKDKRTEEGAYGHICLYNACHADSKKKKKSVGRNTLHFMQEFRNYTQKMSCHKKHRIEQ